MKLVPLFLKAHPEHAAGVAEPTGNNPQFSRDALGAFLRWAVVTRRVHVAPENGLIGVPMFVGRPRLNHLKLADFAVA